MHTSVLLKPRLQWREICRLRCLVRRSRWRALRAASKIAWLYLKSWYLVRRAPFPELKRKYRSLKRKYGDQPLSPEYRRLLKAAHEHDEYGPERHRLQLRYFELLALGFLACGYSREQIVESLGDREWFVRHEVLVRWAWMTEHDQLLRNGLPFDRAFHCVVGNRQSPVRGIDREFYQLIHSLHGLKACVGRELLLREKRETPDFAVEDGDGSVVGVEVTEAPQSRHWAREMDAREVIYQAVKAAVGRASVSVVISDPPSWQDAAAVVQADQDLMEQIAPRIRRIRKLTQLEIAGTKLRLTCRPAKIPIVFTADDRGETSADDVATTAEMSQTTTACIEKKIVKNGKPRKPPGVRPCYLVVYPNSDSLGVDLPDVANRAGGSLSVDPTKYFSEVWLSSENWIGSIV